MTSKYLCFSCLHLHTFVSFKAEVVWDAQIEMGKYKHAEAAVNQAYNDKIQLLMYCYVNGTFLPQTASLNARVPLFCSTLVVCTRRVGDIRDASGD